ncbi:MAG: hypothetical protein ACQETH_03585 [Candidatus Rifleibacteriota bacterium]
MTIFSRTMVRKISILTLLLFVLSTAGTYAQTVNQVDIPVNTGQPVDVSILNNVFPQLNQLQANLRTAQNTISTIEKVSTPIYNEVAPTNMEAMGIAERVKAILGNAKNLLTGTLKTSGTAAKQSLQSGQSPANLPLDQQLAYGVEQLETQAGKIQANPNASGMLAKLKSILSVVKQKLQTIVNVIRAKIFAVGQKVGLIGKEKSFEDGKVVDRKASANASQKVQYADSFSGKLSKGINEGTQKAKASLKNSFSFSNLAVTTTVAVGTNLAIDMIHGEKPSFKKAVKSVASLEFAGSVAASALGAAGGQFASTLVKTFVPGPVGALVGSVIPVMFASGSGQMGANLVTGMKNGNFSIARAWKQIDKTDLVGSSIGSTIGMALGAPIPVVGPIIGGIVGGMLGSKVAKWVSGFTKGRKVSLFNRGSQVDPSKQPRPNGGSPVSIGAVAGGGTNGPVVMGDRQNTTAAINSRTTTNATEELKTVEKKYYDTYLKYNRLVESGDTKGAREIFEELKTYSDKYNALKKALR